MAHLEIATFIRARPERVWAIISDIPGQAAWMVDVRRMEVRGEAGVGAVIDLTSELFGLPLVHDVIEITSWEPPHEFGVLHRGRFTGTGAFRIEPAPGGSIFYWEETFTPPLGPLGELGFSMLIGPHLRSVFGRSSDNLRKLAEAV